MVHVLGDVLSVASVRLDVVTAVRHEIPACFTFVSQEHICSVVPSKPPPHFLRKSPHLVFGVLVEPVSQRAFKPIGVR